MKVLIQLVWAKFSILDTAPFNGNKEVTLLF